MTRRTNRVAREREDTQPAPTSEGLPAVLASPGLPGTPSDLLPVTQLRRNDIVERWVAETQKLEAENRFEESAEKWLNDLLEKAQENLDRLREGTVHWQVAVENGMDIVERLEQALEKVHQTQLKPRLEAGGDTGA